MFDTLLHKWLNVPYRLHVEKRKSVKRPRATIVFLHGIGNKGESWQDVIAQLPDDVTAITVDLLGFGKSPRPTWAKYDVRTQARAVVTTLIGLHIRGRVTIVGHSLGSLVAIEATKRYPAIVKSLLLCSPPLYDMNKDKIRVVTAALKQIRRNPQRFIKLVAIAKKYRLANKTFTVNGENVHSYMETLQASILTQTSLNDAMHIKKPIVIIYGTADPWVKKRNLISLVRGNSRASLITTQAGHEVRGRYVKVVLKAVNEHVLGSTPAKRLTAKRSKPAKRR